MKKVVLDRTEFEKDWKRVLVFGMIALLVPFGLVIPIKNELQAVLLTIALTLVLGISALFFLYREGVSLKAIGFGKTAWSVGLAWFGAWWLAVTLLDLAGSWAANRFGFSLPTEELVWSPLMVLDFVRAWAVVGLLEELAFRGFLHNKLAAVFENKWIGIALAALCFGLWHIPASVLVRGNTVMSALPGALVFGLISFVVFNVPYELTGLLPLLCLIHGWGDFPVTMTLQAPNAVGAASGYALLLVTIGIAAARKRRVATLLKGGEYVS